jgi:hypothetical protein
VWSWGNLEEALGTLNDKDVTAVLESKVYRAEGATPFEQIQNGFSRGENYSVRLIAAMKQAAARMEGDKK